MATKNMMASSTLAKKVLLVKKARSFFIYKKVKNGG
jgi:hypothetical protein